VPWWRSRASGAPGWAWGGGSQAGALQRVSSTFAPRSASGHAQSPDFSLRSTSSAGGPSPRANAPPAFGYARS